MSIVKRVFKNFGALFLSEIISRGLGFLLIVYLARKLGDETFGTYSFVAAFITIFSIFTDFGLDILFIRDVSRDKTLMNYYFFNISGIKLVLCAVTYTLILSSALIIGYPSQIINLLKIISFTLILDSFSSQYVSLFKIIEDMKYISFANISQSICKVFCGIGIVLAGYGLDVLMAVFVIASLLRLAILIACGIKRGLPKLKIRFNLSAWAKLIKSSLPFALLSIFMIIYFRIDIIMLKHMASLSAVGFYNAAYSLFILLVSLPIMFTGVIFPTMSSLDALSNARLKEMYLYCFRLLVVFGILFSTGGVLLARPIINLFYGVDYEPAIIALKILLCAMFPVFISSLTSNIVNIYNPRTNLRIAAFVMVPLNITLNLALIPRYSLNGAAIATLVTEATGTLLSVHFAGRYLGNIKSGFISLAYRPLIAAVVMGVFVFYTMKIWLVPIYAGIYFVVLYIMRGITPFDRQALKKLFKRGGYGNIASY